MPCLPRGNGAVFEHPVYRLKDHPEAQPRAVFTAPHGQWRRMSRFKNRATQCLNLQKRGLRKGGLKNVKRKWARKNEGLEKITRAQAVVGNVQEDAARF